MKKFQVDDAKFVIGLSEYLNGWETTAGFYEHPKECDQNVTCITYDSLHSNELPIDWPEMYWLDDNNKRQRIKSIDFDDIICAFAMEDGTKSREVTAI